jgi:hypothetical protein
MERDFSLLSHHWHFLVSLCPSFSLSTIHPCIPTTWRQQGTHDDLNILWIEMARGLGGFGAIEPSSWIILSSSAFSRSQLQTWGCATQGNVSRLAFCGKLFMACWGSLLWGPKPLSEVERAVCFARSSHSLTGQIMALARNMEKFSSSVCQKLPLGRQQCKQCVTNPFF